MNFFLRKRMWILLTLFVSKQVTGQVVTIDGEIRPRFEFRDGFKNPMVDSLKSGRIGLQRTRLSLTYLTGLFDSQITFQDARIYGGYDTRHNATTGIYEAWAELPMLYSWSVKLGRQGVLYEDGRLFSLAPWSNTGTAHDLVMLKYTSKGFKLNLAYGYGNKTDVTNEVTYDISGMYKEISFLWMQKTLAKDLNMSFLGINEGFQKGTTAVLLKELYYRRTAGGTLELKADALPVNFLLTAYYQFGKSNTTSDLKAYLLAAKLNKKITKGLSVNAGCDWYSGSSASLASTKNHTFNKLYGVNHLFNGFMEYWAILPKGGLINYFAGPSYAFNPRLSTDATFYHFILSENMIVDQVTVDKNLGSEVDLLLNYKASKEAALQVGFCHYFTSTSTMVLKNIETGCDSPNYAYLMLTIKPQFYKSPQKK